MSNTNKHLPLNVEKNGEWMMSRRIIKKKLYRLIVNEEGYRMKSREKMKKEKKWKQENKRRNERKKSVYKGLNRRKLVFGRV